MPNSISQNLTRLQNARDDIADAIVQKGGTVGSNDGFEEFVNDIGTITNTYTSGDEGKVVSNGSLVSQTTLNITTNGTYNTTTNNSTIVNVEQTVALLFVTTEQGVTITVSKGSTTLPTQTSLSGEELIFSIPENGTWNVSGSNNISTNINVNSTNAYYVSVKPQIFGVSWDKSSSSSFTRTDDASSFSEPIPSVNGSSGSSPFDNIYPWSEMTITTIGDNTMVKIPKFWYKITNTSSNLTIQISNVDRSGFYTSPAHRGRTSSNYVYVGRYKSTTNNYKSQSGKLPKTNITKTEASDGCRKQGGNSYISGYYQQDYAMWWTIRLLYLVEFASWDAQAKIGYGGTSSGIVNTGYTDSMLYQTGTIAQTIEGVGGTQYRNIEGLWDNGLEWLNGIYISGYDVHISNSTTEGSFYVFSSLPYTNGNIQSLAFPLPSSDYYWAVYPSTTVTDSTYQTYISDLYTKGYNGKYVCTGGKAGSISRSFGLFYFEVNSESTAYAYIGTRLMYIP